MWYYYLARPQWSPPKKFSPPCLEKPFLKLEANLKSASKDLLMVISNPKFMEAES